MAIKVLDRRKIGNVSFPTLGCDPEWFFTTTKGTAINADRLLPHKLRPKIVQFNNALFFDGLQAEMNVHPGTCREGVIGSIRTCLQRAMQIAEVDSPRKSSRSYRVLIEPVVKATKKVLKNAHEEARMFGCDPDFDAYAGGANPPGPDAETHMYRYAGGHLHLGCQGMKPLAAWCFDDDGRREFIQFCDIIVGIPMVLLDRSEKSAFRRRLYGRAGCYRPTNYGVEYRVPSNFWLKSPELTGLMLGLYRKAFQLRCKNLQEYFMGQVDEDAVRYAIDFNDFDVAKEIWKTLKPNYKAMSSAGSDPFNDNFGTYFGNEKKKTIVDGAGLFEFIAKKGIDKIYKDYRYDWSIRPDKNGNFRYRSNGWWSGMRSMLTNQPKLLEEFMDVRKKAANAGDSIL